MRAPPKGPEDVSISVRVNPSNIAVALHPMLALQVNAPSDKGYPELTAAAGMRALWPGQPRKRGEPPRTEQGWKRDELQDRIGGGDNRAGTGGRFWEPGGGAEARRHPQNVF